MFSLWVINTNIGIIIEKRKIVLLICKEERNDRIIIDKGKVNDAKIEPRDT